MNPFLSQLSWIEKNFVEIKNSAQVVVDLKYATTDNFMHQDVYGGFSRCFLSRLAAERFHQACARLAQEHPQLQFHIWDTLRPRSVQSLFYEHLRGTPFQNYVAAPEPGSLHNFGMALDLTLQTRDGVLLDMGTGFDDFSDLSQPALEEKFFAEGRLSRAQWDHRLLLRELLESQGFRVLNHEWWHFNALPKEQVFGKHVRLE